MATVIYNSNAIIPAPLVNISKEIQVAGDGTKLGTLYSLTLTGTLVAWKGSPQGGSLVGAGWGGPFLRFWTSTGYPADESVENISRLKSIENKQEALRALFADDGKWLEFQSPDGTAPLKCQPRIKSIQFQEGTWFQTCAYTITLEADKLYLNGNPEVDTPYHDELISSATESWQIEDSDVAKTYRLSHTMNAVGKRRFNSTGSEVRPAWQNARDFIQNRMGLGFTSATSFSPVGGNTIVASSFIGNNSIINFSTLNAYNFSRNDSVDELAGSYSLTENWLLSQAASGTDIYTISVKKFSQEPNTTTNVSIQGNIKGFYTNLNDYDARFAAAQYVWANLQGTPLFNRVQTYVGAVTLNTQAVVGAVDYNPLEGTISYNYDFSDRQTNGDTFEEYTISKSFNQSDYKNTVEINGRIIGRRYESDTNPDQKFLRALTVWNSLKVHPVLYNRVVNAGYFPEIDNLQPYPASKKVDMNQPEGIINYTYEFNTRENDNDIQNADVKEEYTLGSNFSRDDGKTTYTINGTVEGLTIIDGSGAREAKYAAASGYFGYVVLPSLLSRIGALGTISNTNPIETEIQRNPTVGTITYNYKFTNEPAPYNSGVLSETITISNINRAGDNKIVAELPVIARLAGPVLQDMNTTPVKEKRVDIETVMAPVHFGNLLTDQNAYPNYDSIIVTLTPAGQVFKVDDGDSWVPRNGRYNRNVRWIYQ